MRKILVSDYDQTFYLNDEDIEKNKKSVEEFRKKGNIFVFATGRSYFDFMNKAEQYKLKWDYLIINHGATILEGEGSYEHCERYVVYSVVSSAESEKVIKAVRETDPQAFINAIRTEQVSGKTVWSEGTGVNGIQRK